MLAGVLAVLLKLRSISRACLLAHIHQRQSPVPCCAAYMPECCAQYCCCPHSAASCFLTYADSACSHALYLSPGITPGSSQPAVALIPLAHQVCGQLQGLAEQQAQRGAVSALPPCWSAALSKALCLLNRLQPQAAGQRESAPRSRVLCLLGSPDASAQYIPTMNTIFSAQVGTPTAVLDPTMAA